MKKKEMKNNLPYFSLVAIVAIVAIVVLILQMGNSGQTPVVVDEEGNIAGEAFRLSPKTMKSPQATVTEADFRTTFNCTDTDGRNYNVKGTTTYWRTIDHKRFSNEDKCNSDGRLGEWFCHQGTSPSVVLVDCGENYHCSNGRCVNNAYKG
jgi:hypothetical protein